jgi:hypothetical protein
MNPEKDLRCGRRMAMPAAVRPWGLALLIWAMLGSVISSPAQTSSKYYWYHHIVDRDKSMGAATSLAYDSKGFPNIAYRSISGGGPVKFARFNGESWQIVKIDNPRGAGKVALALDPSDLPNIIYHAEDGTTLKHARYDGQKWTIRRVASSLRDYAYYGLSIQVGHGGEVHICYAATYDVAENLYDQLTYVVADTANYSAPSRVDTTMEFNGKWNALTLDAEGRPVAAYFSDSFSDLSFARLDNKVWKFQKIEEKTNEVSQGYYASIQRDRQNRFYIGFQNHSRSMLRLAYGRENDWQVEDVALLSGWTMFSTPNPIALDEFDNPYFAYYDFQAGDLKLAYKIANLWHIETVDSVGQVGEYASLHIGPDGMPAIAYYDATHGCLRLAIAALAPPPDTDGDRLPDYLELEFQTDPLDVDTDDDGLGDDEEDLNHNGLVEAYETDPRQPDTDGDGIPDGLECGRTSGVAAPPGIKGTDATRFHQDADPATRTDPLYADTDADGLRDGEEDGNADGRVDPDEPDPLLNDTDADSLADGLEVQLGLSPIDLDSDDDGLADPVEDKNINGLVDDGETDPAHADSDQDGLADGLEVGKTEPVPDPDGAGRLLATDLRLFQPDADPATWTDPGKVDSDNDHLRDGDEDKNHNGRFDPEETNPLHPDTDGDGLLDGFEVFAKTNPIDLDSDDDGLADGAEDVNANGQCEAAETSPLQADSDNDGISDGVERGVTAALLDPDGNGPLLATSPTLFVPDADSTENSDPLLWDTDADGLSDGEEDQNHDGRVDGGETHFLLSDSDGDGCMDGDEKSFGSDPLDATSTAALNVMFKDTFATSRLQGWTVVDEGENEWPSDWFTRGNALIQTSNIWGEEDQASPEDPNKLGTYLWARLFAGQNYKIAFAMRSSDDDELGVMFQYVDQNNYYRFSMNRERRYRQLVKKVDGIATILASDEFAYETNRDYQVSITIANGRIQVSLDRVVIFSCFDDSFTTGGIAFYSWKNAGAEYKNVIITGTGSPVAVEHSTCHSCEVIRDFALSAPCPNPAAALSTITLQLPQSALVQYRIIDVLGRTVVHTSPVRFDAGRRPLLWDGRDAQGAALPTGIYFMQVQVSKPDGSDWIIWKATQKIMRIR